MAKLYKLGRNISEVEVQNISVNGIWLYAKNKEYFLCFKDHPWFENALISQILNVKLLRHGHIYWPELDVDLELESLENPEKYPLKYR
ncbi:MAG: DUF2442 domain-containing protein [Elusimicrobia bacterium]|nr:DUF2442 domain-containing protein [Elusimicrobiota bacterium]